MKLMKLAANGLLTQYRSLAWRSCLLRQLVIPDMLQHLRKARELYATVACAEFGPVWAVTPSRVHAEVADSAQAAPPAVTLAVDIVQDVQRLYFEDAGAQAQVQTPEAQMAITRVLHTWVKLRAPKLGYRQGMHEIAAILYWVCTLDALTAQSELEHPEPHDAALSSGSPLDVLAVEGEARTAVLRCLADYDTSARLKSSALPTELQRYWDESKVSVGCVAATGVECDTFLLFDAVMQDLASLYLYGDEVATDVLSPKGSIAGTLDVSLEDDSTPPAPVPSPSETDSAALVALLPSWQAGIEHSGITLQELASRVQHLRLHQCDPTLEHAMMTAAMDPQVYTLRWSRLIFAREFPLPLLLRVWDIAFAARAGVLPDTAFGYVPAATGKPWSKWREIMYARHAGHMDSAGSIVECDTPAAPEQELPVLSPARMVQPLSLCEFIEWMSTLLLLRIRHGIIGADFTGILELVTHYDQLQRQEAAVALVNTSFKLRAFSNALDGKVDACVQLQVQRRADGVADITPRMLAPPAAEQVIATALAEQLKNFFAHYQPDRLPEVPVLAAENVHAAPELLRTLYIQHSTTPLGTGGSSHKHPDALHAAVPKALTPRSALRGARRGIQISTSPTVEQSSFSGVVGDGAATLSKSLAGTPASRRSSVRVRGTSLWNSLRRGASAAVSNLSSAVSVASESPAPPGAEPTPDGTALSAHAHPAWLSPNSGPLTTKSMHDEAFTCTAQVLASVIHSIRQAMALANADGDHSQVQVGIQWLAHTASDLQQARDVLLGRLEPTECEFALMRGESLPSPLDDQQEQPQQQQQQADSVTPPEGTATEPAEPAASSSEQPNA